MVEIKADESISGFAQAAQMRAAQRNPEPEPEVAPEPQAEPVVAEPASVVEETPAVEQQPEETPEVEGEAPAASPVNLTVNPEDPQIITEMLHENTHRAYVNRLIYGDAQIADAFRRRADGTLGDKIEPYAPLPHVQELMAAAGENQTVIGFFLGAQGNNRAMASLEKRIGAARMENLKDAMDHYEEDQKPKGFFAAIGDDLGKFATKGDIFDAPLAGMAGFGENLRSMQMGFAQSLANLIGSKPNVQARITPKTEEELAWLDDRVERRWIAGGGENKVFADRLLGEPEVMDMPADIYDEWMSTFRPDEERIKDQSLEDLGNSKEALLSRIDSGTGQFMAVATEYMATYIVTPGFSKGATAMGKAVNGLLKGAMADAVVYNEGDANVSAMLQEWGVPGSDVLEFLATDPDDSEVMNMARVIAEGATIGVGIETLGFGMLAILKARKGDPEGAMEAMAKSVDAEAEGTAVKATEYVQSIEDLKAEASKGQKEIADAAKNVKGAKTSKEFFQFDRDSLKDWTKADDGIIDDVFKFVRTGTNSGASSKDLKRLWGKNWMGDYEIVEGNKVGKVYRISAEEMHNEVAAKLLATLSKIQEPTSMNQFKGMALRLMSELDEEMLDPNLVDRVRHLDPSEWSNSDAANIFAAGMLQDAYVEQMARLTADLASNADQLSNPAVMAKLQRLDALEHQVAALQLGKAKMGTAASHAFHSLKGEKKVSAKLAQDQAHIQWQADRNLISEKRRLQLMDAAFKNAKNKRAKAKVANQIATKPTTMEKLLHVSNANLLFNTSTQALMLIGNFVRATIRNPMVNLIEAAVVNPIEGVLGRADWASASSKSFQRFWHSYGAIAQSLPEAMTAFAKFWRKGKSQFGENSMFDDKGYYANKTLAEVRQSKAEGTLDHGMKAAEHVYRFMGAVDEMFKEIVIYSEMATHARAGTYGDELMKLAKKGRISNADFKRLLKGAGFASESTDGRMMDTYARDVALDTMFQSDPAKGSLNKTIKSLLMGRTNQAMMARLIFMRFVTTPLNVMEERMATVLSPLLLVSGDNNVTRAMAGKFARDLKATLDDGSPDMRVRSRTRAVLAANSVFTGMGILSAYGLLKGDGDEGLIDVDPKSRTYGHIRVRMGNGKKRYINTLDLEVPFLNAFVFARMATEHVKHAQDIEQATEYLDTIVAISAMYLNQTLEKSSLKNMTDSLAVIMDDNFRGGGQFAASNLSTAVPFNWWMSQIADLTNGGEFQGKPNNFYERLGKSIGPLKLMGFGAINQERDALGRLQPSQSRGFNPFVSREFEIDELSDELADIQEQTGTDFLSPSFERDAMPYHKMKAREGQSVYDFMQESIAAGDVKIGGMTLEEAAKAMINGDYYKTEHAKWQALLAERHTNSKGQSILKVGGGDVKDPRVKLWRDLLSQYRDEALRYALNNVDPEVRQELEEVYQTTGWTDSEKRFVRDQF